MGWMLIVLNIVQMVIEYVISLIKSGRYEEAMMYMRAVNKLIVHEKQNPGTRKSLDWDSLLKEDPAIPEDDLAQDLPL